VGSGDDACLGGTGRHVFPAAMAASYGVAVGWPDDPGSPLIGPRGRRLCWSLAGEANGPGEVRIGPAWGQVGFDSPDGDPAALAAELAAAVGHTDWGAVVAGMSEAAIVAALAESVTWAMYWQAPDRVEGARSP
jgi:hypothetical protein